MYVVYGICKCPSSMGISKKHFLTHKLAFLTISEYLQTPARGPSIHDIYHSTGSNFFLAPGCQGLGSSSLRTPILLNFLSCRVIHCVLILSSPRTSTHTTCMLIAIIMCPSVSFAFQVLVVIIIVCGEQFQYNLNPKILGLLVGW